MSINRILTIIIGLISITAVAFFRIQSDSKSELEKEQRRLKTRIGEMTQAINEIEKLRQITVDVAELEAKRQQHRELMKLRSDVADLREMTAHESEILRADIQRLRLARQDEIRAIEQVYAKTETREWANDMREILRSYLSMIDRVAVDTFPRSHAEFVEMLNQHPKRERFERYWQSLTKTAAEKGYPLNPTFEYIPHAAPLNRDSPERPLLREKEPHQLSDGTWARHYGTTGIDSGQLTSATSDFTEIERSMRIRSGNIEFVVQ